jgi:hypothetical protein
VGATSSEQFTFVNSFINAKSLLFLQLEVHVANSLITAQPSSLMGTVGQRDITIRNLASSGYQSPDGPNFDKIYFMIINTST